MKRYLENLLGVLSLVLAFFTCLIPVIFYDYFEITRGMALILTFSITIILIAGIITYLDNLE
jgi:hypothetical protein